MLRQVAKGLGDREIAAVLGTGRSTVTARVTAGLARPGLRDRTQAVVYAHQTGLAAR